MNKLKSIITDDKLCNLAHCSSVWLLVNTVLMTALACRCDKKAYGSDVQASSSSYTRALKNKVSVGLPVHLYDKKRPSPVKSG